MSDGVKLPALDVIREARAIQGGKIKGYFPDNGALSRKHYPQHIKAIELTKSHNEVMVLGANRVGKTELGVYFVTTCATGEYPDWWPGRYWDRPISVWACGDTGTTVRDILQEKLIGPKQSIGSGFIPRHRIHHMSAKRGLADAVDTLWVKHVSGGLSEIRLKSYDQRREAFAGTNQDLILNDEEPPMDIYSEQLLRLLVPKGLMLLTLTPIKGLTDLITSFQNDTNAVRV